MRGEVLLFCSVLLEVLLDTADYAAIPHDLRFCCVLLFCQLATRSVKGGVRGGGDWGDALRHVVQTVHEGIEHVEGCGGAQCHQPRPGKDETVRLVHALFV